ncbi:LysM peptidoglycan-binding domain-containing protein [Streptomyces zhaozhouensis]|nr:transglycosylase family protein [Streptomyces zhaozhouensis]
MPLLSAGSASAVSDDAWDRAAECESGGRWSANDGNGQFGGFQLTLERWERFGGLEFAIRPDLASRMQQIAVVERMMAELGHGALPGCGVTTGVWKEYRQEQRDEGDRAEEAEEAQAEEEIGASPEDSSGETEEEPPGDGTPEPDPADETPEAGDQPDEERAGDLPDEREESTSGGGRHRGDPDPAESGADGRAQDEDAGAENGEDEREERSEGAADGESGAGAGGDRRQDGGEGRGDRAGDRAEEPADGAGEAIDGYQVVRGDTLSHIALEHDISGGWPALYRANETVIGGDPDLILPGQRLDLTASGR